MAPRENVGGGGEVTMLPALRKPPGDLVATTRPFAGPAAG